MPCQISLSRLYYEKSLQQGLDNGGTFQVHTNLCTHFRKAYSLYGHEAPSPETWIQDCVTTGQARLVVEWVNTPACYPHHRFSLPSAHSLVRINPRVGLIWRGCPAWTRRHFSDADPSLIMLVPDLAYQFALAEC